MAHMAGLDQARTRKVTSPIPPEIRVAAVTIVEEGRVALIPLLTTPETRLQPDLGSPSSFNHSLLSNRHKCSCPRILVVIQNGMHVIHPRAAGLDPLALGQGRRTEIDRRWYKFAGLGLDRLPRGAG
jgi:hypothetical protein